MPYATVVPCNIGRVYSRYEPDEPIGSEAEWFKYLLTLRKQFNEIKDENNFIHHVDLARSFTKLVQDIKSERSANAMP
jgi:hypothetical protein